ncbi:hypothetical protein [Nocardiopsis alkaliphila]|uniref:hypothetical protein n=1 Tax=Nocardiopsis alkaliphila TaxID=225762 RepID=UPI00034A9C63|nr:hypothetical protein [Nocardiopsis alkaliphila]
MSWSRLVGEALPAPEGTGAVERLRVRPEEVSARVGDHEVSLIRPVWSDRDWTRVCAALASQPVFRARVGAGELPPETARVFALLGLDLVPAGWGAVVATCSCDHWRGRCTHLGALARALGAEADLDPFVLTRWAGREKRAVVLLVNDLTKGSSSSVEEFDDNPHPILSTQRVEGSSDVFAAWAQTSEEVSPDTFWNPIPQPSTPDIPPDIGDRVRASAPRDMADELPRFTSSAAREERP